MPVELRELGIDANTKLQATTAAATKEIIDENLPKQAKKRQHHKKTKTGCLTCKIRRVKCDEAKPVCSRCTQARIKCDGYVYPIGKKLTTTASPPNVATAPHLAAKVSARGAVSLDSGFEITYLQGSTHDQRCFDFFVQKTAPLLSSSTDKWFWSKFLLQICHSEPTIWHSILALSTLHEEKLQQERRATGKSAATTMTKRSYAIQHYNRAIKQLTNKLAAQTPSLEVVLVSCVIFISLETLLGNVSGAIKHLHSGMDIVRNWHAGGIRAVKYTSDLTPRSIDENIIPLLENLNNNVFMYGETAASQLPFQNISKPLTEFEDITEARESLLTISSAGQQLAVLAYSHNPVEDPTALFATLMDYQKKLVARATGWGAPFERLLAKPRMQHLSAEDKHIVTCLKLLHQTGLIWANNALYTQEVSFDRFLADFERAVDLGEESLSSSHARETSYSYDGENLIPIYFTAVRCRNPTVRRRAVNLLRRAPPREGFWDTRMIVRIVEKLIELEEAGLEDLKDSSGAIVPSEWARIHQTNLKPKGGGLEGGKRRLVVTYVKKLATGAEDWGLQYEFDIEEP